MNVWYPGATVVPGPAANVYPEPNAVAGVIEHSAEGQWSQGYGPVDTMRQRGVSWLASVFRDGHIEQHYPLNASCWHAGSKQWNVRVVGIEHEGDKSQPLTAAQLASSVTFTRWIAAQGGWKMTRGVTLFEHKEVYPATTCPNGRIPWQYYYEENVVILNKADDQTQAVQEVLSAVNHAAQVIGAGTVYRYQSGDIKDEAGNVITIPADKVGTFLIHDA